MKKEYANLEKIKDRLEKAKTPGEISGTLELLFNETQFLLSHSEKGNFAMENLNELVRSCMMHDTCKATIIGILKSLTA